jgi:antirestriction protein ArdC
VHAKEDKVRKTLEGLVRLFESGEAPAAIARSSLPSPSIPASEWSLSNRLLLWIEGTGDARGFRQWEQVGRHVRKGATAIYILAPTLKTQDSNPKMPVVDSCGARASRENDPQATSTPDKRQESNTTKRQILCGFRAVPVFRFEDTDGQALQAGLEPPQPPPLMDVAKAWALDVRYIGYTGLYLGYYRHNSDRAPELSLATHDQQVFFHELAHAAQYRVLSDLKPHQKLRKEITAELAASVLMRLCGTSPANDGASFKYIQAFCDKNGKSLSKTLWGLVADTEQIINAILSVKTQAEAV